MITVREIKGRRETDPQWDGAVSETRFYRISRRHWDWLCEHGSLCAVSLCEPGVISVAAYKDQDGWNGWGWLHDELLESGL